MQFAQANHKGFLITVQEIFLILVYFRFFHIVEESGELYISIIEIYNASMIMFSHLMS